MNRLPCYLYKNGVDFSLPPVMDIVPWSSMAPPRNLVLMADGDTEPGFYFSNPEYFVEVPPEEAEIFLFPFDLNPLVNLMSPGEMAAFMRGLPYFSGRERRHVFMDMGDKSAYAPLPVLLCKCSLLASFGDAAPALPFLYRGEGDDSPSCIPMPYMVPPHVLADRPDFNFSRIRYDCSFVGGFNHIIRNAACASVAHEPDVRFFDGSFESIESGDTGFYIVRTFPQEETARRQELFRRVTKDSLMVLCPPGIGPQSFRFYETLYYGRIPVLFTQAVRYPLEHLIEYDAFSFRIALEDVLETGRILKRILHEHSKEDMHERCVRACKTWNAFFREEVFFARLFTMIREYLQSGV